MKSFPLFVSLVEQTVVIVGGDETAAQKARLFLKTEADIAVMAPELNEELSELVAKGRLRQIPAVLDPDHFSGARIVISATGCAGGDAAIADLARRAGALVNVVDRPELCDFTTPAIVDRDPLVVAIGTEGAAPVLARQIKTRLEDMLEPALGRLVRKARSLRPEVAFHVPKVHRRAFWEWFFRDLRSLYARQDLREADREIARQLSEYSRSPTREGSLCVVGTGPGAADLLTLRAVQRLQSCDVIFHAGSHADILELARRDAERVDSSDMSEAEITAALWARVDEGDMVCLLLPGNGKGSLLNRLTQENTGIEHVSGLQAEPGEARVRLVK